MADTNSNDFPATALSEWLRLAEITANRLATIVEITPRSAYSLARGDSDLVSTKTLIAVSNYTGLTIDDLLRPYYASSLATDTGSARINTLLAKIGAHLHTSMCKQNLARFIHPDFLCSGSEYAKYNVEPMNFENMCLANAANPYTINSALLSATWFTPGAQKPNDSTLLHTYWRAMLTDKSAHTSTDTTFVILEFVKSISELEELERPQIIHWWWHRPTELHAEFADKRVKGFIYDEEEIDLHAELRTNQFRQNIHLNPEHTAYKTNKFSGPLKTDD